MREPSVFDDLFSSSREILVDLDAHDTRSQLCSGKCNRAVTTAELIDYIRRADLGPSEGSCGHICRCWQPAHEALPVHPLCAREQQQLEQPKPRHPIDGRGTFLPTIFFCRNMYKYFPKLLGHIGINSRKKTQKESASRLLGPWTAHRPGAHVRRPRRVRRGLARSDAAGGGYKRPRRHQCNDFR